MNSKPMILVIEDDETVSGFVCAILSANDYNPIKAVKGKEGVALAASHSPDLILLDLGLPDMDGIEVLKTIRSWTQTPVIVVSARYHEREKVEALDLGANDYVTKPFGTAELLARIRNAMRQYQRGKAQEMPERVIVGGLEIHYEKRLVSVDGKEVHVTPIEYKLVVLLSKNLGKVLTYDFIMREIWGPYANEIESLRVNMANIRRKLEKNPAEPRYIVTEVGVGYRMVDE
ncbi:MAG TPA: response regulator transcription factor [Clostridia bacterium]|nr:response regulator transcription factor [Clostridia bacterium]